MALTYDFDLTPIFPPGLAAGSMAGKDLGEPGMAVPATSFVASFRNPSTASALRGAAPEIRQLFQEAGFGFQPSGGTLPTGNHDKALEALIDDKMERLMEAHEKVDLTAANWNGFQFEKFLHAATHSVGVDMSAASGPPPAARGAQGSGWPMLRMALMFVAFFVIFWELTSQDETRLLTALAEVLSFGGD